MTYTSDMQYLASLGIDLGAQFSHILDLKWSEAWCELVTMHYDLLLFFEIPDLNDGRRFDIRLKKDEQLLKNSDAFSLAEDYWSRNRFHLKEYFINLTKCRCIKTELSAAAAIAQTLLGGWIHLNDDPVYPSAYNVSNIRYADVLHANGMLAPMLYEAEKTADIKCSRSNSKSIWQQLKNLFVHCSSSL